MTREQILATSQERWLMEVFHKSLKQNAIWGKAPVRRVVTQNNRVVAVLYAIFKLECLKMKRHLGHFAWRAHLYLKGFAWRSPDYTLSRLSNICY